MVAFDTVGDNDFRAIFASVREEYEEREERREAERMLRMLDELERRKVLQQQQDDEMAAAPGRRTTGRVERLRISARGDIEDDDAAPFSNGNKTGGGTQRGLKREAGKVHTLDDLPRESEFEMLFGVPEPVPEPSIKVETGMRLHDGKAVHRAIFPGFEDFQVLWSGISFENILFLLMIFIVFLFVLFKVLRFISRHRQQRKREQDAQARIDEHIRIQVQQQVNAHLQGIRLGGISPRLDHRVIESAGDPDGISPRLSRQAIPSEFSRQAISMAPQPLGGMPEALSRISAAHAPPPSALRYMPPAAWFPKQQVPAT